MFKNREEAGKLLAKKLPDFKNSKDTVVLGITRGGVVVAQEISKRLKLPLEIIVIKKIGSPLNPELAIGAVGPDQIIYWEDRLFKEMFVSEEYKNEALRTKNRERIELEKYLRGNDKRLIIKDKIIILVDDGVATGTTVLAAAKYFRKKKARQIILVLPVIARDTLENIDKYFDTIMALEISNKLSSIGQFYQNFEQVENNEVKKIIDKF